MWLKDRLKACRDIRLGFRVLGVDSDSLCRFLLWLDCNAQLSPRQAVIKCSTYSLHCSSLWGLQDGIVTLKLLNPKRNYNGDYG